MPKCSPLHKVSDDARWDAEDLFGRLCILAHAAFLYAGFHPSSASAATPWSLSRRYSVLPPDRTAAESHQDVAAIVVLRVYRPRGRRRRRGSTHMALRVHVTANGIGRYTERRERICRTALETFLAGCVDDAARAIRAPGSAAYRLWKLLSDEICRDLFLYACAASSVPVMPDFASLPGDIKMAILEKVDDAKHVAMVECTSKELRDLVSGHDPVLWKAKYEAIISSWSYYFRKYHISVDEDTPLIRWKERYVKARHSKSYLLQTKQSGPNPMFQIPPLHPRIVREAMILFGMIPKPRRCIRKVIHETRKATADIVSVVAQRRAVVEENRRRRSARQTITMVSKRSYRKEHQAGAVHSPSSRYHWKHR